LRDFDAEWYLKTYPDVALSGLDPAKHYLVCGLPLGRQGSPVKKKAEGALIDLAGQFGQNDTQQIPQQVAAANSPIVAAPSDIALIPPSGGAISARDPDMGLMACLFLGDTELGRAAEGKTLAAHAGPVAMLAKMMALAAPRIAVPGGKTGPDVQWPAAAQTRPVMASPGFMAGPARILNAWFSDSETLRLSVEGHPDEGSTAATDVIRAWQISTNGPADLLPVGGMMLPKAGQGFFALSLGNPLLPVLLELADSAGSTKGFALLAFPSLLRGGMHATERAAHQLGPNPMSEVWRLSAALVGDLLAGSRDSGFAVSRIAVRLGGATGAEALLSRPVRIWLERVFGLGPTLAEDTGQEPHDPGEIWLAQSLSTGKTRGAGLTLVLPPQAIPTLQALVSRRMALPSGLHRATGPYLVSEAISHRPLWSVCVPMDGPMSTDMPLLERPASDAPLQPLPEQDMVWAAPLHLAIIGRPAGSINGTLDLFPVAPDVPYLKQLAAPMQIAVVFSGTHPELALRALSSLKEQAEITVAEVLIRPLAGADNAQLAAVLVVAERIFSGRVRMIPVETGTLADLDAILEATQQAHVLMLDESVLLQDSRILPRMAAELLSQDDIASVGCMLMYEEVKGKSTVLHFGAGGVFPAGVSLISAPRLAVAEPNTLKALPASTYPVLANTFGLCLIRRSALLKTCAARAGLVGVAAVDLHFGLSTWAAGWRNLCTSVVRAATTRAPSGRDEIDPFGLDCLAPARWDDLLSSVTVLRELRG